jgi:2-iminobutanoate/2-iminopropanoate deaminase
MTQIVATRSSPKSSDYVVQERRPIRGSPIITAVLAALLCGSSMNAEAADIAKYDDGPFSGPYSESARVGDLLFLAGQVGEYADGKLVAGGIKAEAEQIILNIKAALGRRGLGMEHVVKCTVFLADVSEWGAFNEVYKKHFSEPYPARTAFAVSGLVLNARAEMECIAGIP